MRESGVTVADGDTLEVEQAVDPDGYVRLSLRGELDQVSAALLHQRLEELKASREPVRIDLSELEFIDSSGVRAILLSVRAGRADGWIVEVDRQLSWQVQHVFDALGLDAVLWPEDQATP
jgi:anti-anti-sigma factor